MFYILYYKVGACFYHMKCHFNVPWSTSRKLYTIHVVYKFGLGHSSL